MRFKAPIGLLGGSFDPVHHGHLRLAVEAQQQLQLDHVRMIPLHKPAHREFPGATAEHRLCMLKESVTGNPKIIIDEFEINNDSVSYTIDTLKYLHRQFSDHPLCWIMGIDSFATLHRWKNWQELFQYSHFLVAGRPHSKSLNLVDELNTIIEEKFTEDLSELHTSLAGKIMVLPFPVLNISSTRIRELLAAKQNIDYLMPKIQIDYIQQNKLYQKKHAD